MPSRFRSRQATRSTSRIVAFRLSAPVSMPTPTHSQGTRMSGAPGFHPLSYVQFVRYSPPLPDFPFPFFLSVAAFFGAQSSVRSPF